PGLARSFLVITSLPLPRQSVRRAAAPLLADTETGRSYSCLATTIKTAWRWASSFDRVARQPSGQRQRLGVGCLGSGTREDATAVGRQDGVHEVIMAEAAGHHEQVEQVVGGERDRIKDGPVDAVDEGAEGVKQAAEPDRTHPGMRQPPRQLTVRDAA